MAEHPKFDEGTQALMREIARMAATQALQEHWQQCPVHDLKAAVFGNGRPGLRREMIEVQQQIKEIKETNSEKRGAYVSFLTPLLATLTGAFVLWLLQMFAAHAK